MTEPTLEDLIKENSKLKQRIKRLEKRVKKLKARDETLAEEILELDQEVASEIPIYEKKIEGRCPKCGAKTEEIEIPGRLLIMCTKCQHRETK